MSEKRFELTKSSITDFRIYDNELEDAYFINCDEHTAQSLVSLLNFISEVRENQRYMIKKLDDENRELRQELNAQKSLCNYYRMKYKELLDGVQENLKGELVIK